MDKQKNILFIMADELRADVTGFGGNCIIRTPNLDRLAAKATVFDNAYTPSPICIPARQCLTAGQFPTTCKCMCYGEDLPADYSTFPKLLAAYGYETVACGKLHHMGKDQMQGYTRRIGGECRVEPKYLDNVVVPRTMQRKGFKWSQQEEVMRATTTAEARTPHLAEDELAINGAEMLIYNHFVNAFYKRATPEVPLLLMVSFNQPHYPYVAEPELLDYYMERVELFTDQQLFPHEFMRRHAVDVPEENLRKATAAYYAMVEKVDSYVGRLLQALEEAGQNLDDWMVIFTSDHGEMLGEHGVWEKQKFFEGSVRVPLFISLPGQEKYGRVAENVNLCDIFATICSTMEIPIPEGLDSRDMVGLILGTEKEWDNETVSMFDRTNIMIKREQLKYQYYAVDCSEILFDLEYEPEECTNLIGEVRYQEKVARFRERIRDFGFEPKLVAEAR